MGAIKYVQEFGGQLIVADNNGNTQLLVPTGRGTWIPAAGSRAIATGSGESSGAVPGTTSTPPGSMSATIDDYPWPDADEDAYSPLRYSYRDCTDFVAWRINRDDGCTHAPWKWNWGNLRYQGVGGNGDAIGWRHDWQVQGRGIDLAPAAGRIAWFGSSAGQFGHVAYVQSVNGGMIKVEEYNWGGTQNYGIRTISASTVGSFLAPH